MTFKAETNPASFPTKLRYLSAFMAARARCQREEVNCAWCRATMLVEASP
jgi:hypothetical protein